jgi:hypothetical protein
VEVEFGKGPLRAKIGLEMVAVELDRRLAFTTFAPGSIHWEGAYTLDALPTGGTRLSQAGTLRFRGWWRLLEPIVGAEIRAGEIKELERLKTIVETNRS